MSLIFELGSSALLSAVDKHFYPLSEWVRFIVMMVNFALLVYIVIMLAKKPILSSLKSNREKFLEDLRKAKTAKEEAERLLKEAQAKLAEADEEVKKIVRDVQKQAELLATEIIESAKLSAKKILEESQSAAKAEVDKIFNLMKKEIIKQAVLQAEELVRKKLTVDLDKHLVDEAIKAIEKDGRR